MVEQPEAVEAALWRRLRVSNEAACRQHLFDRHMDLARRIARHEWRRRPPYGLDRSDFEHLAFSGLLEAIDRFDPLKGARFESFAKHRIRGAIADGLARSSEAGAQYSFRRRTELDRLRSLSAAAGEAKDSIGDLWDLAAALAIGLLAEQSAPDVPGYESQRWRALQVNVLEEIEHLPDVERAILEAHYFRGTSFSKIAEDHGLSKGRISQLHRAALLRVRERLKQSD